MFVRVLAVTLFAACLAVPLFCQTDAEAEAAKQKAIDVFLKGELDEALKLFDAAIKRSPGDDELPAYRAAIYLERRDFEKADADLAAALKLNPNSMLGYHNRGYGKWLRGDHAGAVADYSSAIHLGVARHARRALTASGLAGMYQNRGVAYEDKGDLDRAAIDFTRCIQLHPERGAYYVNRALVYLKRGMHEEAISDLDEALFLDPLNPQTRVNRAYASYLMDDFDAAVREYTRALYLKPDYLNALVGRGNAQVARGQLEDAATDFGAAIKLKPDLAAALAGLGLVCARRGDWPGAEAQYRKAVAADARDAGALRGLAVSLWRQNRRDEALAACRSAAAGAPASAPIWHDLAQLCVETGQHEEALVAFNRALELEPSRLAARRLRAEVHARRAEWLLAASDLRQAVAASPADGDLRVQLAQALSRKSKAPSAAELEAALAEVRAAAQCGIAAEALRGDERLAALRSDPRFADAVQGK